ncbi:MAG: adenosylcobinamide-phosphate synthase CbiB [Ancalomicrobiaceae bacterium]|nr:adenosylcobinamide-phosphate synthase CbiB [Ancalomicrobiaceae bacterium]
MFLVHTLPLAAVALLIEAAIGYPAPLYHAIGHPVTWIGALIAWSDRAINRPSFGPAQRRALGVVALIVILGIPGGIAIGLARLLPAGTVGLAVLAVLAASLPAQRSLHAHVSAVADGLESSLDAGRRAVSMIVGRNPAYLDEAGVARAAIESLAENFSDGIVAPAFWLAIGGLPGGVIYKAANTADSMIGHKTERHRAFGWAAARFDDLVNLPASRLAALWIGLAALITPGASAADALRAVVRDAGKHRSPNAGWPEAALAGALGLQLAGPRVYGESRVEDAFMGEGRREAAAADIRRALRLYKAALAIELAVIVTLAVGISLAGG